MKILVGGADQGEIAVIGDGEDDAAVGILEEIGAIVREDPPDHDVRALHQAHMGAGGASTTWARTSATQGPAALTRARATIERRSPLAPSTRELPDRRRSGDDERVRGLMSAPRSAASIAFRTTSRESSTVQSEYSKAWRYTRLQGNAGRILRKTEAAGRRQELAAADMIVEEEAEPQQPARAQTAMMRQDEAHRADDVRRDLREYLALGQRLVDEPELVMLEIAQAAVNELGGSGGRRAGKSPCSQRNTENPGRPRPARCRSH